MAGAGKGVIKAVGEAGKGVIKSLAPTINIDSCSAGDLIGAAFAGGMLTLSGVGLLFGVKHWRSIKNVSWECLQETWAW